jgi:hypothetical protein
MGLGLVSYVQDKTRQTVVSVSSASIDPRYQISPASDRHIITKSDTSFGEIASHIVKGDISGRTRET